MHSVVVRSLCAITAAVLLTSGCRERSRPVQASGAVLLRIAQQSETPPYPEASLRARIGGAAVVKVLIGLDGAVRRVDVLEAPNPEIAASLSDTLSRWTFLTGTVKGKSVEAEGTLSFYFDALTATVRSLDAPPKKQSAAQATNVKYIDHAQAKTILSASSSVLLDIRSRSAFRKSHSPESINIPFEELQDRAGKELRDNTTVVIDCPTDVADQCPEAARLVRTAGVPNIYILGVSGSERRSTVEGTLRRGIELLENKDYITFLKELVPAKSISILTRSMPLELYVEQRARQGAFESTLTLLRACLSTPPRMYGDTAIFVLSPPIAGSDKFAMYKIDSMWYLGI